MYAANRLLFKILVPFFVAQILIMIASLAVSIPKVMATPSCIETTFPVVIIAYTCVYQTVCSPLLLTFVYRISSIVFEGVLFGLTVYKYRGATREGWGQRSLLNILVRDSVWAFALVFGEQYSLSCARPATDRRLL